MERQLNCIQRKFKQIHQTISSFTYKDKRFQLSYRILDMLFKFNLALTLTIQEESMLNNSTFFICLFGILNPVIILIIIMRFLIRQLKQIQRIAAFISQFLLILFLMIHLISSHMFVIQ
ncbi:unnamed protein product [Paramecium octaurelia]|uniref:Transmembrane protein n=1 Tax=Paramecium octaurelia TaxID=43137 RepID=A0A8S1XJF8_PAROT|nr:unnamed protein product [Paramecium octaurelia]